MGSQQPNATYDFALRDARAVPGVPVFGQNTRHIGVIVDRRSSSVTRPRSAYDRADEVLVAWSSGKREWRNLMDVGDLDRYLDAEEASLAERLSRRQALSALAPLLPRERS